MMTYTESKWWAIKLCCPRHPDQSQPYKDRVWKCGACEWHRRPVLRTDAERDGLVERNLGLAYKVVGNYLGAYPWLRNDKDDMVSQATMTLMRAAEMWDGVRPFSTYATGNIQEALKTVAHTTKPTRAQSVWGRTTLASSTPSEYCMSGNKDPRFPTGLLGGVSLKGYREGRRADDSRRHQEEMIMDALKGIPPDKARHKQAVELTVIGDLTLREASKVMGVSKERVAQLREKCIDWLRKRLVKEVSCGEPGIAV